MGQKVQHQIGLKISGQIVARIIQDIGKRIIDGDDLKLNTALAVLLDAGDLSFAASPLLEHDDLLFTAGFVGGFVVFLPTVYG